MNIKKTFSLSILISLASQLNLKLSESNFVFSAGVIVFAAFLYYYEDINSLFLGVLSGSMVYLFRLTIYYISYLDLTYNHEVFITYMPEILFYICYPVFYKLIINKNKMDNIWQVFFTLIFCDFFSNLIEVLFRYFVLNEPNFSEVLPYLLTVSFARSFLILVTLAVFKHYDMMLTKREHEERYKKLLLLTSQLKVETFWLEKNMNNIENVMARSYKLFEQINNNENRENWSIDALNIARDVHEIKKENGLAIRGILSATENELNDKGMEYKDINDILIETVKKEAKNNNKNIEFEFIRGDNFYTCKHYHLLSIIRNLLTNSIDAISESQTNAKISVIHSTNKTDHIFQISDNGSGIDENDINSIFSPGFSTKINYDTGEINRGLGLSIVQYVVEEQLQGKVKISSKLGVGTTFTINIPKTALEEI